MNLTRSVSTLVLAIAVLPGVVSGESSVATKPGSHAGEAVRSDPLANVRPAASMEEIDILSHGARISGRLYLPRQSGPHPIVIFLHGYPGNERNLDLLLAVQRAGYAALYFDYRGDPGSGGTFSFAHSREDVASVLAWVRVPQTIAKYHIDAARIAMFGYRYGGALALSSVGHEPPDVCVAAPAAWNAGWVARRFAAHPEEEAELLAYLRSTTDASGGPIHANADELIKELADRPSEWDYLTYAGALSRHAVLLVAGTNDTPDDSVERQTELARAIEAAGGKAVQLVTFKDNESFAAHRLALADRLLRWLRTDCARTQIGSTTSPARPSSHSNIEYPSITLGT